MPRASGHRPSVARLGGVLLLLLVALTMPASASRSISVGTPEPTRGPEGWTVLSLATDPGNPATVYAGTDGNGVSRSADGGRTWTAASAGLPAGAIVRALVVDPARPATLYAGTDGAGLFRSADAGASWTAANEGLGHLAVFALALDPTSPTTVYAGTGGAGVFKSVDGGRHWTVAGAGLPVDAFVRAIAVDPTRPSVVYAGLDASGVFKSADGGQSWSRLNNGLTSRSVQALALDPAAPETLYAGTLAGGVFKTADGGESWAPANTGLTSRGVLALALAPGAPGRLYAGTLDGLFESRDGGASWRPANGRFTRTPVFAVTPGAPSRLFVGTEGSGVGSGASGASPGEADAAGAVRLEVNPTGYGKVDLALGQKVFRLASDAQKISATFGTLPVYARLEDPTIAVLDDPAFERLSAQPTVRWYLAFRANGAAVAFTDAFFAKFQDYRREVVVELKTFDYATVLRLKSRSPWVRVHAPDAVYWPREIMRGILDLDRERRAVDALSFHTRDQTSDDLFDDVHLMFDTVYDAAKDIEGGTGIYLNYPPGAKLALSGLNTSRADPQQNLSFLTGVLSAVVVVSVQTQNHPEKAPPRYVIVRDPEAAPEPERLIYRYFADFLNQKPELVWPWAVLKSGGPWKDRPSKPVVGAIGRTERGYSGFLTNTSGSPVSVAFNFDLGLTGYELYSSQRGKARLTRADRLELGPYETVAFARSLYDPSGQ